MKLQKLLLPSVALITLIHFLVLAGFHEHAYDSPDAHGYFMQGKLIAETGSSKMLEESPTQAIGIHWIETAPGEFYSRYPTGFPFLIAIVYKLFGPGATIWINVLLTSLCLPLIYYVTERWSSPALGIIAMLLMAVNPIVNQYALNADSHSSTLFMLLAGLATLTKWEQSNNILWAAVGGFLLGYIPSIRYPEVLYGLGIAVFLLLIIKKDRKKLPGVIAAVAGAALPILYTMVRNSLAFGAPWRTAYALTNEQTGFSMDYFMSSYSGYLDNLMTNGLGPVFILGILGIVGLILKKRSRRWGVMFLVVIVPITLLYMSYYFGNGGTMTMRFLLPTFPIYIVSACYLVYQLSQHWRIPAYWIGGGLVLLVSLTAIPASIGQLARNYIGLRANAHTTDQIKDHVPEQSAVFMGRQLSAWAEFAGDWKVADEQLLSSNNRFMGMNRPAMGGEESDRPSPRQMERRLNVTERYQGLLPEEKIDLVVKDVITWAGADNDVFWIGDASQIERAINLMDIKYDWVFVAEIDLDVGIEKDWRDVLANSFQAGGRGRGGPGGMSPGGGMAPNQNTPFMMQDRFNRTQDSQSGIRPQRNTGPNQGGPFMRQRPGGTTQSRRSPFQSQTSGSLSIYKLVVSNP